MVNKVANSGLITIDFASFFKGIKHKPFDIAPHLYQGLILKEKDFRTMLSETNWEEYQNCVVSVYCSTDAIVPLWAFMLLASELKGNCKAVFHCQPEAIWEELAILEIQNMDLEKYNDGRVIVKGCSEKNLGPKPYMDLVQKLKPVVKSIMFGEPCSTVPLYKRK